MPNPQPEPKTPPLPALPSLRDLKDAYSDAATIDRRETGRLNARLGQVERDCVDWYAEATKIFVAGTEIGDLIRAEIPVSSDGDRLSEEESSSSSSSGSP